MTDRPENDLSQLEQSGDGPQIDLDAVLAAVNADIDDPRRASRLAEQSTNTRIALGIGLVTAVALLVLALTRRADLDMYPTLRLLVELATMCSGGVLMMMAALRPVSKPPLPPGLLAVLVTAALAGPLTLAMMPQAHAAHVASLAGIAADFVPRALGCLTFGVLSGVPLAALLWLMQRGDKPRHHLVLVLAGAAGLSGLLALHLHCPITHAKHLLWGHAFVPTVLTLAVAALAVFQARAR